MHTPSRIVGLLALSALLAAPPARAEQPMDRFEKMIEAGKAEDVVRAARKWLERNIVDDRRDAVVALLHEAAYAALTARPSVQAARAYQEDYPTSERLADARVLEANLALYAAAEIGTEAAYLEVAQSYPGTKAAREGRLRAEDAAFDAARGEGTAAAWGDFLSDYRGGARFAEAQEAFRACLWEEAAAEDTVEAWLALRSSDPEHPRVAEAFAREAELAFAAVDDEEEFGAWNRVARRYIETPPGVEALRKAARHLAVDVAGAVSGEEPAVVLEPSEDGAAAPASVEALDSLTPVWPGRLPRGVTLEAALLHVEDDAPPRPWSERGAERAAAWGAEPGEEGVAAPCVVDPDREQFLVRASVLLGDDAVAAQDFPVALERVCRGPSPFALARGGDGTLTRWARRDGDGRWGAAWTPPAWAGFAWPCTADVVEDPHGVWAACAGREIRLGHGAQSAWIRPASGAASLPLMPPPIAARPESLDPPATPAESDPGDTEAAPASDPTLGDGAEAPAAEAPTPPPPATSSTDDRLAGFDTLPEAPEGSLWLVPGGEFDPFAADRACVLSPPAPGAEESKAQNATDSADPASSAPPSDGGSPPPLPSWLPPDTQATIDRAIDVTGDGSLDRVLRLDTALGAWFVVAPGEQADWAWVAAAPDDASDPGDVVARSRCDLVVAADGGERP